MTIEYGVLLLLFASEQELMHKLLWHRITFRSFPDIPSNTHFPVSPSSLALDPDCVLSKGLAFSPRIKAQLSDPESQGPK